MTTITTEAIYEKGILKPLQPIPLAEGTRVEVIIISTRPRSDDKNPKEILAKIAALPLEGSNDKFSGREHDTILYPQHNAT